MTLTALLSAPLPLVCVTQRRSRARDVDVHSYPLLAQPLFLQVARRHCSQVHVGISLQSDKTLRHSACVHIKNKAMG